MTDRKIYRYAVCFSGYPRFVKKCFANIHKNLFSFLDEFDVYAHFQWDVDWQNMQIHHEFHDKYEKNQLTEFLEIYKSQNLKKIKVIKPYNFDLLQFNKLSAEPDMKFENIDASRKQFYRSKCQYQSIADCVNMVDTSAYDFILRLRTDNIFERQLSKDELLTDRILCQSGKVAGFDRKYSDWFFLTPAKQTHFFNELANIEEHYKDGIIHMHRLIEKIGMKYNIEEYEFNVYTASIYSYKNDKSYLEFRK